MSRHHPAPWLALSLCLATLPALGSDLQRERGIAAELSDAIIDGESVFLEVDGHEFWNILMAPDGPSKGAVIILHGRGLHPDWPAVARPLRTGLPGHGWTTFSMQMPVLHKGAGFADYAAILTEAAPRIDAGIRHLRGLGYHPVHLLAHSCGVHMVSAWLDGGGGDIDALVLVSHGMTNYERRFGHPPPLARLSIPVLDIYGGADFVAKRAPDRLALLREGGNPASRQVEIPGARHMLQHQGAELVDVVADWLDQLRTSEAP